MFKQTHKTTESLKRKVKILNGIADTVQSSKWQEKKNPKIEFLSRQLDEI
jgi:hypothetical protein